MATAAALVLHDAVIARLKGQCPSCPRWYSDDAVPPAAVLPYGVIGMDAEVRDRFLMRYGSAQRMTLRWFSDDREDSTTERGAAPVLRIWAEVMAALEEVKLTLTGHTQLLGNVQLIETYRDQEGYRNAVAHYIARTLNG